MTFELMVILVAAVLFIGLPVSKYYLEERIREARKESLERLQEQCLSDLDLLTLMDLTPDQRAMIRRLADHPHILDEMASRPENFGDLLRLLGPPGPAGLQVNGSASRALISNEEHPPRVLHEQGERSKRNGRRRP